ncbi:MAG: hypothetical protein KKH37_09945 [Alphaproteobacteria bacterium]|nr:hypothetical protein [Alphaproteobacteria bacterium]
MISTIIAKGCASAVLEEAAGEKSYWAVSHPTSKPDFHHADGLALALKRES